MVEHDGLMRILWPADASRIHLPGVLVGFKNSDTDVFVVGVLREVELSHVENALLVGTLLRKSPHGIHELLQRCGRSSLQALGVVNTTLPSDRDNDSLLRLHTTKGHPSPRLCRARDECKHAQIVIYNRPKPQKMQYLSLTPISLALGDKKQNIAWDAAFELEAEERKRKERLVQKLKLHKVIARTTTPKEVVLPLLVEQVNCSYELNALLQKNIGIIGRRMRRALSVSELVAESANNLWDYAYIFCCFVLREWLWPFLSQVLLYGLMANRIAAEGVLRVLHWRPATSPEGPTLRDISATAQQIDIRLQQFCYWPIQYIKLRKRRAGWGSITNSHLDYIRFYNSLWLVANDIILGIALGSYIIDHSTWAAAKVETVFGDWSVEGLRSMISWLMGWPGGLKLNTELADFLGDLFLWVIDYWAGCISVLRPHLPALIQFIGFSAFGGATLPISLFIDLVSLLTMHIYSFYVASARIFHWQLTIMISLFHLFRGKKRNILRHRIDSCDYDLDQLLLGTILFTLQFFLLPTVFVFYLTFACARVAVISLKAALEIGLACLNHFPLFAVMLRIKDPGRLPGGISFELQDTKFNSANKDDAQHIPTSCIRLNSIPLSLRAMFHPYFELGGRIRKHYLSPSVFMYLASGQFVPPIHRRNLYSLQYSMLPATRASVSELWEKLTERTQSKADVLNGQAFAAIPQVLQADQNLAVRKRR